MSHPTWKWVALVVVVFVGVGYAQEPRAPQILDQLPPFQTTAESPGKASIGLNGNNPQSCPSPNSLPSDPSKQTTGDPSTSTLQPSPRSDALSGEDLVGPRGGGAVVLFAGAGAGSSASTNGAVGTAGGGTGANGKPIPFTNFFKSLTVQTSQNPLILPGLFTSMNIQSAQPTNRISFDYGYFDQFRGGTVGGAATGFNLNSYGITVEQSFLDQRASVYIRVPFLYAADNTTGQTMNGLGDLNFGLKFALFRDRDTGSTLSAGFTVAVPTAPSLTATTTTYTVGNAINPAGNAVALPSSTSQTVNPTFLQPYLSGIYVEDRFFVQGYVGCVLPTDSSVSTFMNTDLGVGYQVYQNRCGLLSSITPTFDVQLLDPINHRGSGTSSSTSTTIPLPNSPTTLPSITPPPLSLSFVDQVFLAPGCRFGLGNSAALSVSVIVPVAGPTAYSVGGACSLSLFW